MSITARPLATFSADFRGAPNGLGSTLACGIRRVAPDDAMVEAATAAGITETDVGATSVYTATRTAPAVTSEQDADGPRYEVVWFIAGVENASEDLFVSGLADDTPTDAIPSVGDVSAILHERVVKAGGQVATEFDATTNPTATQVATLIDMWAPLVLIEFGDISDDTLVCGSAGQIRAAIRALIAAHVAKVIESSYWPQDVIGGDTAENYWGALIDKTLPKVVAAARECAQGDVVPGGDGDGVGATMAPRWQFNTWLRVGDRGY